MEEEKAAAYYNELLGKGRNAALFKQGLGFGTGSASAPKQHHGMTNFVGAGKATEPEEESGTPASKHGMIGFVGAGKSTEPPPDRDVAAQTRAKLTKKSSGDVTEKRDKRERRDNKGRSPSRSHGSPRDRRHRSRSRSKERSRSKRSSESSPRRRRSRSRDRSRRYSRSRSRDRSHKYHKDRSRSRDRSHKYHQGRSRSRDRSRSRERRRHQRDRRSRSRESERRRRSRSRSRERSRRDYKESRRSVSPGRRSDRRLDSHGRKEVRAARKVERDQDWAKLIPGFDSMTPAEKVKAKMKLQLAQTVVKDSGKGVEEEWERFDFNKEAPLDDDAKQDYFGDGTGASADDIARIDNLGGSHLFVTEQAKREARLQAAHEDAIFGAPVVVEDKDRMRRSNLRERERSVSDDGYENDNESAPAKVAGVLSEQIIALQAGSSWQERIKKMRAAQAQDESLNSE